MEETASAEAHLELAQSRHFPCHRFRRQMREVAWGQCYAAADRTTSSDADAYTLGLGLRSIVKTLEVCATTQSLICRHSKSLC